MIPAASLSERLGAECASDWREHFDAATRETLREIARTGFIDTAACMLAGRDEPVARLMLAPAVAQAHPAVRETPGARVLFGPVRQPPAEAACLNAIVAHALDFDDVGLEGHPSVVLMPALLAAHEVWGVRGFALVQAWAKGYAAWGELHGRMKVHLHGRGWHPTAIFGTVAAAAALAAARGLDATQATHALGIAASCAAGVVANFGSMTKPLQVGRAVRAGFEAVAWAEAGLSASPDALDGAQGLLAALGGPGGARLEGGLAEGFAHTLIRQRPGIKKYPVCYAAHRVVDGVLELARRHALAASEVSQVDATISDITAGVLRHHEPATLAQARFSLEFCVSAALCRGALGQREVSEPVLADPAVRALIPRVRTHTIAAGCPIEPSFAYEDRVVITCRDGRVLDSGPIRFALGHAQRPLDAAQLREKLMACLREGEEAMAQTVWNAASAALDD